MNESNPLGLSDQEKGGAFFLYGNDDFRKEGTGHDLVEWHLEPGTRDFNFDPLRGSEVDIESLASVLATPPMMAEWRVVLLREVEGLASSPRARDVLLEAAKNPPPGLALIMLASIPKGSKAKFYQQLRDGIPAGRLGEPEDVARTILWLASDDSDYITGLEVIVDGGFILQ